MTRRRPRPDARLRVPMRAARRGGSTCLAPPGPRLAARPPRSSDSGSPWSSRRAPWPPRRSRAASTCRPAGSPRASRATGRPPGPGRSPTGAIREANLRTGREPHARRRRRRSGRGRDRLRAGPRSTVGGRRPDRIRPRLRRRDGALLGEWHVSAGFLNDVIVTKDAAYVTDSGIAQLIVIPLGRRGSLPGPTGAFSLPLSGDIVVDPAAFNANGITAARGWLLIVQSNTGLIFRVEPGDRRDSRPHRRLRRHDRRRAGDPRVDRHRVVRNQIETIAVLRLNSRLTRANEVGTITMPDPPDALEVPTTATIAAGSLWAVNARFGIANPPRRATGSRGCPSSRTPDGRSAPAIRRATTASNARPSWPLPCLFAVARRSGVRVHRRFVGAPPATSHGNLTRVLRLRFACGQPQVATQREWRCGSSVQPRSRQPSFSPPCPSSPAASLPPAATRWRPGDRAEHTRIVHFWTPARVRAAIPRDFAFDPVRGSHVAPKAKPTKPPGGGGGGNTTGASWPNGTRQGLQGNRQGAVHDGRLAVRLQRHRPQQQPRRHRRRRDHGRPLRLRRDRPRVRDQLALRPAVRQQPDVHLCQHRVRLLDRQGARRSQRLRLGRRLQQPGGPLTTGRWRSSAAVARRAGRTSTSTRPSATSATRPAR